MPSRKTCAARAGVMGIIAVAALTSACASTGAVPRPFPVPGGSTAAPSSGSPPEGAPTFPGTPSTTGSRAAATATPSDTYALVGAALALRGRPYRNGGADPNGFDCSGFTQYVYGQYGIALPRDVEKQFRWGNTVRPDDLAAGDLVFFSTVAPGASHVAIAVGGDEFVHAPSSTGVVRVERLSASYWSQRFVGARRPSSSP